MAGNAKPDVRGLGKEGKITFSSTDYHNSSGVDSLESLTDEELSNKNRYGVLVSDNSKSHFKFTIYQKSNIYAYGNHVSDSSATTPKPVDLYKMNNNGEFELLKNDVSTQDNEQWYLLFDNLDKGTYQIVNKIDFCEFAEWYIESIRSCKFLLEQNNQLYTIKSEFYEPSKSQYKPITGVEVNNITDENLKKYGFDDIGDILKTIDKGNLNMLFTNDLEDGKQFGVNLKNGIKKIDGIRLLK